MNQLVRITIDPRAQGSVRAEAPAMEVLSVHVGRPLAVTFDLALHASRGVASTAKASLESRNGA